MKIEIEKVRQKGKRRRKWKRRASERSKREGNEYGKRKKDEINRHPPPQFLCLYIKASPRNCCNLMPLSTQAK